MIHSHLNDRCRFIGSLDNIAFTEQQITSFNISMGSLPLEKNRYDHDYCAVHMNIVRCKRSATTDIGSNHCHSTTIEENICMTENH